MRKAGVLLTVVWFSTMSLSVVGGFGPLAGYFFALYIPSTSPAPLFSSQDQTDTCLPHNSGPQS